MASSSSSSSSRSSSPEPHNSPAYGDIAYWDRRYEPHGGFEPFDWLFGYEDIRGTLEALLPDRQARILVPGCGDAPFSVSLYEAGYHNTVFCDLSQVAISKQRSRFPHMTWEVQDVLHLTYPACSFDVVLDKSLIDTLMCFKDAKAATHAMVRELRRVLRPGGLYVTLSLHTEQEVLPYLEGEGGEGYGWAIATGRLRNPAHDLLTAQHRERSIAHTIGACQLPTHPGQAPQPPQLQGLLSREEEELIRQQCDDLERQDKLAEQMRKLRLAPRIWNEKLRRRSEAALLHPAATSSDQKGQWRPGRRAKRSEVQATAEACNLSRCCSVEQLSQSLSWALEVHSSSSSSSGGMTSSPATDGASTTSVGSGDPRRE